jgi:hypothetical protein
MIIFKLSEEPEFKVEPIDEGFKAIITSPIFEDGPNKYGGGLKYCSAVTSELEAHKDALQQANKVIRDLRQRIQESCSKLSY